MKFVASKKVLFTLILLITSHSFLNAQPIYTSTLTGTPLPYNVITGAYIPSGNTVTIVSGATIQFNFGLTIESGATLIVNGATIRMADNQSILLEQTSVLGGVGARLNLNTGSRITSLTSSPSGNLWAGIACTGGSASIDGAPLLKMDGATIDYAQCAYTHYDPNLGWIQGFGRLHAVNSTFRNNMRCLDIGNTFYINGVNGGITNDDIAWMGNYAEGCTFELTADFDPSASGLTPPDMIRMRGAGLILHSCSLIAKAVLNNPSPIPDILNPDYALNTTAIDAAQSIIWLERQTGSSYGCNVSGFRDGLLVNNGYGWGVSGYNVIVSNSGFSCTNEINVSGSGSPLVIGSEFTGGTPDPIDNCSIFLRNCPFLRVEDNLIEYDYNTQAHCFGIVAMNSGDADNLIYRNHINDLATGVGIESIGTNRSAAGDSGLKILCNYINNPIDFTSSYNIAVMQDAGNLTDNGIHNDQYETTSNRSAGNQFSSNIGDPYSSYYLESGTNNMSAFNYRYDPSGYLEVPLYTNITNLLTTVSTNSCPVINTRNSQPSMLAMASDVKDWDGRSFSITADPNKEYGDLRPSGAAQTSPNFINLQAVQKWLQQNNHNWTSLPAGLKENVYQAEATDPGSAGAIARSLLHLYEGKKYDPVVLYPKPEKMDGILAVKSFDISIYPNPAHGKTTINWGGTTATLRIVNIAGQVFLTQVIENGATNLDISRLVPGIYLLQIQNDNKQTYTQKLTIQ